MQCSTVRATFLHSAAIVVLVLRATAAGWSSEPSEEQLRSKPGRLVEITDVRHEIAGSKPGEQNRFLVTLQSHDPSSAQTVTVDVKVSKGQATIHPPLRQSVTIGPLAVATLTWIWHANEFEKTKIAARIASTVPTAVQPTPRVFRIGAAGGVSGEVWLIDPDGTRRRASTGLSVNHQAKLVTGANGRIQVLLLDETVFTVGPNSEMYLDEFVYDPDNALHNKLVAKITKGIFRFVTGKIARKDPENVTIKLPVGYLGIRGTDLIVEVSDAGATTITMLSGAIELALQNQAEPVTVTANYRIEVLPRSKTYQLREVEVESLERSWREEYKF